MALREGHSRHTLPLSALAEVGPDLFVAVRLVLTDIFNAFGRAEVPHITQDGALRLLYFADVELARWAAQHELPTTPVSVEE
jgi:hypothetical protein